MTPPPITVTIKGERGERWERVCGTRTFPVTSLEPLRANLPGKPNATVWLVDIAKLEPGMLEKIVAHLSQQFGLTEKETREDVIRLGIPILAEDAFAVLNDPQRWL